MLIGRTVADLATNVVTLMVMLLIGFAVGFRPSQPIYEVVLALALVLAFAYVFSWISAFIGVTIRDPETVQSVGLIWVFPLVRALTIGHGHALVPALGTLAWLVGLLLVFVPLTVRAFRRS
jgi:ABC-2 type transport system permease protein/oleandomycin transport system permease protein